MPITVSSTKDILTIGVTGEIDHHTAADMRDAADAEILARNPKVVRLDFSRLEFMDSSGLGFVMGRYKTAQAVGAEVKVSGASKRVRTMLVMSGVERYVKIE